MDEMRIIVQPNWEFFLETIMRRFGVSIVDAHKYHRKHRKDKEFVNIRNILSSGKEEDVQRCLALLHILANKRSEEMIEKYCHINDHDTEERMTQIKDYVDKYKLQLITALDYDKDFVEDVKKRYKGISSYQVAEAARNGNYRVPSVAAADVMEYIKPIDFYRIKDDSLGGEWVFYGSKICEQFIMEIHFEFSREKSGEDNGRVPFFLEVDIMLEDSEKLKQETPVTIPLLNTLENEEGAVIGIKSSRRTINYTNGFSFTRKKITP